MALEQAGLVEQVLEDYYSYQDHTRLMTHFVSLPTAQKDQNGELYYQPQFAIDNRNHLEPRNCW